jgi:isocitrate/isopropylmalate dehydrogenase
MNSYSVALIGGDGIGPEILREGKSRMPRVAGITVNMENPTWTLAGPEVFTW